MIPKNVILIICCLQLPHVIAEELPGLKTWLQRFLQDNPCMIASQPGRNLLLMQVQCREGKREGSEMGEKGESEREGGRGQDIIIWSFFRFSDL